jgi:hypothetical protein
MSAFWQLAECRQYRSAQQGELPTSVCDIQAIAATRLQVRGSMSMATDSPDRQDGVAVRPRKTAPAKST